MPSRDAAYWTEEVRRCLQRYDEALLRQVAGKLIRPRNQWPAEELIERSVAALANPATVDRRLQELDPACRRLLALVGHSRQPRWRMGGLLELLAALGHAEGPRPIFTLFEAGLLFPDVGRASCPPSEWAGKMPAPRLKSFEAWLGQASATGFTVFAHPHVSARALGEDLGLPELACPPPHSPPPTIQEADGLEWPLRLAVVWQQIAAAPLRRTQQGEFFKRDLDRLLTDPLLATPPADHLAELPDPGLLAVALAESAGLLREEDGELRAEALPANGREGLPAALASLWAALPHLRAWNVRDGGRGAQEGGNPYASAYLLAALLLGRLPEDTWARPDDVEAWLFAHHPYWLEEDSRPSRQRSWVHAFLLGLAYPLRLVQAVKDEAGEWRVRLAPLGRWVLGLADAPAPTAAYLQTLLVQPNLEVIAYRQGLTPELIGQLSRFAAWKTLGPACTLALQAECTYRALESGFSFEAILQTLQQHGMKPTPPAVVESLRTWADKRDRISIYPSGTLFEFGSPDDLNEAFARGLPATRLSDRLAIVAKESAIDYRHFRLTGTRDYGLPPEKCVEVEPDGVTLAIDLSRSDLLLETELQRFAEPVETAGLNGRRRYRLTPASLTAGQQAGLSLRNLDEWFKQRAGQPVSAAAQMLLTANQAPPVQLKSQLVLHVATEELADGLVQWPQTRALFQGRLGPTALLVAEEDRPALRERLQALGIAVEW